MMHHKIAQTASRKKSEENQTFLDHLRELRGRLFVIGLVMLLGSAIGYSFNEEIIRTLLIPLHGQKLMYLTPGGGFDFIFKASFYVGCLLTVPVLIFQLYRYLAPLLTKHSRRMTTCVLIFSVLLAIGGMLFGFYVALPAALNFLTSVGSEYLEANLTASSYLNFVAAYLLGLALLFQLPLILMIINVANGPLPPRALLKSQQFVLPGTFILAAIITPTPDIANQAILALPVIIMYEIGILLVMLHNRKHRINHTSAQLPQTSPLKKTTPIFVAPPASSLQSALPKPSFKQSSSVTLSPPNTRRAMDIMTPKRPVKINVPQRVIKKTTISPNRSPGLSIDGMLFAPDKRT